MTDETESTWETMAEEEEEEEEEATVAMMGVGKALSGDRDAAARRFWRSANRKAVVVHQGSAMLFRGGFVYLPAEYRTPGTRLLMVLPMASPR